MRLFAFQAIVLLFFGITAGCYPPRVENPPAGSPPSSGADPRVDVKVRDGKVDVDAEVNPPRRPKRDVDVEVKPGGGVDIDVKPKP